MGDGGGSYNQVGISARGYRGRHKLGQRPSPHHQFRSGSSWLVGLLPGHQCRALSSVVFCHSSSNFGHPVASSPDSVNNARVSPFAHVLLGVAHINFSGAGPSDITPFPWQLASGSTRGSFRKCIGACSKATTCRSSIGSEFQRIAIQRTDFDWYRNKVLGAL